MAFIQKYLIYILIAVIAILAVMGGIQYARVLKAKNTINQQADKIVSLNKENADMLSQISDYKKNIAAIKVTQADQQQIANSSASLQNEVNQLKTNCTLEASDEKIIFEITNAFNNGVFNSGVRVDADNTKTGKDVLSKAGQADIKHWTVKQIVQNYLAVINYTLQLEKTVLCYETVFP